jgi:hypothetical protein
MTDLNARVLGTFAPPYIAQVKAKPFALLDDLHRSFYSALGDSEDLRRDRGVFLLQRHLLA